MNIKLLLFSILIITYSVVFVSCTDGTTENNTNNKEDTITENLNTENENSSFFLVPSPEGMFAFTQSGKLKFSGSFLNSTENVDKYIDTKSKELNFGVYSADLAYVASYNKYQESIKYLNTVKNLSNEIGISSVFNKSLIKRIDNIMNNKDSLIKITSDTYFDIVRYLEKNERNKSLALIVAGGWVESLFIVTNLVTEYSDKDETIQLIADQKVVFQNLMALLDQNKEAESVKTTIEQLKPIQNIFDKLETVKTDEKVKNTSDKIVVGGNTKIKISEEQFKSLKQAINKVRNSITNNNV